MLHQLISEPGYIPWMERSDNFTNMNEVQVRSETTRKKQLATWWQHMEEQSKAIRDQFKAFPTQLSNMGGHNKHHHRPPPHVWEEEDELDDGYKSAIPFVEW